MTDGERVYCLLRSLTSYIETPRGSLSGRTSGLDTVHGRWISCSRCAGGRVIGHGLLAQPCLVCKEAIRKKLASPLAHGCRPCLNCEGGWRRARVGEQAEDPYLKRERGADVYAQRDAIRRKQEDELARARSLERRLEDEKAVREGRLWDLGPEGWEYAREALRKRGSYDVLDRALAWLADHETLAYRVLMSVEVNNEPVEVNDELRAALDRIVRMVVGRMRLTLGDEPILVPFWLLVEHRSVQLERAFSTNQGFREIATEVGISERRVRELRREWQERKAMVA